MEQKDIDYLSKTMNFPIREIWLKPEYVLIKDDGRLGLMMKAFECWNNGKKPVVPLIETINMRKLMTKRNIEIKQLWIIRRKINCTMLIETDPGNITYFEDYIIKNKLVGWN